MSDLLSARIKARFLRAEDAPILFALATSDADTVRYVPWRVQASVAEARELAETFAAANLKGEKQYYVVESKDGVPIGFGTLKIKSSAVEIGFIIGTAHRRRGYAVELIRLLAESALARPQIHRVEGVCDVENVASSRAMEKAGFIREERLEKFGAFPNIGPERRDVYRYVVARS